jgi:uncharacterized protein
MYFRLFIYLLVITFISACTHATPSTKPQKNEIRLSTALLDFYRGPLNHLSAVRHGECPMYPSCSVYSRKAIETYGGIQGWIMTFDRLMRCGRDETRTAPRIYVNGRLKYYDPLENNIGAPKTIELKGD